MIKYFCDRCGKEIYRFYKTRISYTGADRKESDFCSDFCKECKEELSNWVKNKPAKDYEKKIEDYEKATHNYRQQIIDLTEKLDKTKGSRDWWYNQYTEMLKDYNALRKKVNEIMLYGGMKIV
jgi:uncharacterized coiled-coil DUF342 family protein